MSRYRRRNASDSGRGGGGKGSRREKERTGDAELSRTDNRDGERTSLLGSFIGKGSGKILAAMVENDGMNRKKGS